MNKSAISPAVKAIDMPTHAERTTKTVKIVSVAVCTITTAVMCANLVAMNHGKTASASHSVKLIYMGRLDQKHA